MKNNKNVTISDNSTDTEVLWEAQPSGLWGTFLSTLHLNFTWYKITKDELIVIKGFFNRHTDSVELYLLKDPDMRESLWQRFFSVGTVRVLVDSHCSSGHAGKIVQLKNIKEPAKVRKLLRDRIEVDVMERGISYFDKI